MQRAAHAEHDRPIIAAALFALPRLVCASLKPPSPGHPGRMLLVLPPNERHGTSRLHHCGVPLRWLLRSVSTAWASLALPPQSHASIVVDPSISLPAPLRSSSFRHSRRAHRKFPLDRTAALPTRNLLTLLSIIPPALLFSIFPSLTLSLRLHASAPHPSPSAAFASSVC